MKILLHMGQGKTGTTSLQKSLDAASELLRERKVLYPQFGDKFFNHHLLLPLLGNPGCLFPTVLERLGGPPGAVEAARVAWDRTCEDVQRSRPELLVLSSEYLALGASEVAKIHLNGLLSKLSADITPIIYVRHPVDHFRSLLQQWLKHRDTCFPPKGSNLKLAIQSAETAFSRRPELVVFDRKKLHGGDVVEDFATRFLAPWVTAAEMPRIQVNVGLSAEALVLMAMLRAEGGGTYEAAKNVARLIPDLEALDLSDPPAQPFTLLPEVAETALRSATSYRWLAETGQLEMPGLDASRIDGAPVPDWMLTSAPHTLFLHDPERLDRLRLAIESRNPEFKSGAWHKRRSVKPLTDSKPRLRDSLLRFLQQKLASSQDRKTGTAQARAETARPSSQGDRNEET